MIVTRPEGSLRGRLHPALPVEGATQAPIKTSHITVMLEEK